ncbi:MAG: trypsin-like peptidase domain-containing protein [Desulfobacterales bacterium]
MKPSLKQSGLLPITVAALLTTWILMAYGCATSSKLKANEKTAAGTDAPIFDKRFSGLSFKDIDLSDFWVEGGDPQGRPTIPIHNHTIAELADGVKDGVVNLYTFQRDQSEVDSDRRADAHEASPNSFVSKFLKIFRIPEPIPSRIKGFSLGSGFIINANGYILTSAHVIENATDIRVVLFEGRAEYPAKIIGIDRLTDSALIKIETGTRLKWLPWGDSDNLKTGEMVIAVGNPFGLRHTVTSGIVSAQERVAPQASKAHLDFIQTDSAINPGSSGGPLLNLHGEVVGINTAVVSKAQSIGFAIPINTIKEVMPMLVLGKTERGWFGVKVVPVDPLAADALGYPGEGGGLIIGVENGSPAEKAGLTRKDIIVKLNGKPLINFMIFRRKLLGFAPGNVIHLTIFRDGRFREVTSTLVRREVQAPEGNR